MREVSGRIKELEAELETVEADRERARRDASRTRPTRRPPTATPTRTPSSCARSASGPTFDFEVRDHLDLGRALGLIETEKAAAASGSRFAYLIGDLVLVELALIRFAVEVIGEEGFTPGRPAGARPRGGRSTAPASSPASGR